MSLRQRRVPLKPSSRIEEVTEEDEPTKFSVLDILRMLGGVLLLNFILSYYITGTPLWGTNTRLTNPRYLHFHAQRLLGGGYIELTEEQLALYDGSDPQLPIYIAINGSVYDVSSNARTYGPIGSYSFFSGKDAARAYVTGCFRTDLTHDLRELDPELTAQELAGWQAFYGNSDRYWYVGTVTHPPLTGPVPEPCMAQKRPM